MKVLVVIGLILSLLGIVEAFNISYLHYTTKESCPMIASIPACYVVLVSYALMSLALLSSLTGKFSILKNVFWFGLTPALILAILGVSGEIFGFARCPRTSYGVPKCYLSLAFAMTILISWVSPRFQQNDSSESL